MVLKNMNSDPAPPLADYFFIAGIESSQVFDEKLLQTNTLVPSPGLAPVETTIEEDEVLDTDSPRPRSPDGINNVDSASANRRSRLSMEARKSMNSMLGAESKSESNRSSVTIRGGPAEFNGMTFQNPPLNEVDFDNALRKFAAERESFLEEIHFSAGALPQMKKPKRAKTHRILSEESSILKSSVGSIRRRLSTMNSLKRQPSILRQGKSALFQIDMLRLFNENHTNPALKLPSKLPSVSATTTPSSPTPNRYRLTQTCIRLKGDTNQSCSTGILRKTWSTS
jgi:hypothetical protein